MSDKETETENAQTMPEMDDATFDTAIKQIDGLKVGFDNLTTGQKLGVLQRLVTAVGKDDQYRQILLTAAFENKQEALLAADAISERVRYGVSIQPIVDRMLAQCSVNSDRVRQILAALSQYTLHTNYTGQKPYWQRRDENKSLVG